MSDRSDTLAHLPRSTLAAEAVALCQRMSREDGARGSHWRSRRRSEIAEFIASNEAVWLVDRWPDELNAEELTMLNEWVFWVLEGGSSRDDFHGEPRKLTDDLIASLGRLAGLCSVRARVLARQSGWAGGTPATRSRRPPNPPTTAGRTIHER